MKIKQLIALLLAALMLLSITACGKPKETSETSPAETTEQPAQEGETETAQETEPEDPDAYHGELPFVKEGDEPITISIGVRVNGNVTDYKDNKYTKYLEEKTGLNLEFIQFTGTDTEAATQVSLMIASGEKLPDILHTGGISKLTADEYGLDGYLIDLTDYMEKYGYYQKLAFDTYFPDDPSVYEDLLEGAKEPQSGKMFAFPMFEDCPLDTPNCHAWINQEWLDKLGLEIPHTLDELHEVLVAFRDKDPNGNGKQDEIPMIGKANSSYVDILRPIINSYVFWSSSYHYNVDENGKLWSPYNTDEYRQALILINDWVKEGLISTLTWTQTSAELKSLINPSEGEDFLCGVICGHADVSFLPGGKAIYVYSVLPPFEAVTDKGGYAPRNTYSFSYGSFITESCEHPVEAFKLLDFFCSPECSLWARWGEQGVNWDYSDGSVIGNLGGPAKLKLMGDPVFSTQNSQNWHTAWTVNSERYWEYETEIGNLEDWDSCRATKLLENYQNYEKVGQLKTAAHLNYTQEENERRTDINNELLSYIRDRRAQFCTGTLDPRDDAQWKEYLDGLNSLNYDEWLAIGQSAYDRHVGK